MHYYSSFQPNVFHFHGSLSFSIIVIFTAIKIDIPSVIQVTD